MFEKPEDGESGARRLEYYLIVPRSWWTHPEERERQDIWRNHGKSRWSWKVTWWGAERVRRGIRVCILYYIRPSNLLKRLFEAATWPIGIVQLAQRYVLQLIIKEPLKYVVSRIYTLFRPRLRRRIYLRTGQRVVARRHVVSFGLVPIYLNYWRLEPARHTHVGLYHS